jgi:hypothetical protein
MCENGTCGVSAAKYEGSYEGSNDAYDARNAVAMKAPSLPQIMVAVERTAALVADIEQAFDVLSLRLNPVSRFSSPALGGPEADEAFRAPLAATIEGHNERIAQLTARIRYALEALEV